MDKCLKCGECCRYVIRDGDKFIKTDVRCLHLQDDNLCSIYAHRPYTCHRIEDMERMDKLDMLPDTCGYRRR